VPYMISLLNRIFFNNYNLTVSNFLTNSKRLRSILEKIKHFHCNTKKENSLTVMYIENGWSLLTYIVQFETRNFGHHCQYTVKKCKIGFTLLLLTLILPFAMILIDVNRK
jgi:hypothetical protein